MGRLPVLSGAETVRAFERAGWRRDRQRGSHVILIKPGNVASLSLPQHRDLCPGTFRAPRKSQEYMTCFPFSNTAQGVWALCASDFVHRSAAMKSCVSPDSWGSTDAASILRNAPDM
ncbi:MAG: type II toxin-antitoxin system HicA family toxin [Planctomycetota bacterium]